MPNDVSRRWLQPVAAAVKRPVEHHQVPLTQQLCSGAQRCPILCRHSSCRRAHASDETRTEPCAALSGPPTTSTAIGSDSGLEPLDEVTLSQPSRSHVSIPLPTNSCRIPAYPARRRFRGGCRSLPTCYSKICAGRTTCLDTEARPGTDKNNSTSKAQRHEGKSS